MNSSGGPPRELIFALRSEPMKGEFFPEVWRIQHFRWPAVQITKDEGGGYGRGYGYAMAMLVDSSVEARTANINGDIPLASRRFAVRHGSMRQSESTERNLKNS